MGWTVAGPRRARPRPSYTGAALALLFALQTFLPVPAKYPAYMTLIAIAGAAWFTWVGVRARVLVSLPLLPVALLWLAPLLGATWFNHMGPAFFLAHAALAMLFGIAAYTYASTEKA